MTPFLLHVHLAVTWYLVGLCWLVQRVQYPLMAQVGAEGFASYEAAHVARIGPVVALPMLLELGTGVALGLNGDAFARSPAFLVSLALLGAIWLSTFLIQVPLHGQLGAGFDVEAHARLVSSNWVRTLAWSIRALLVSWLFWSTTVRAAS